MTMVETRFDFLIMAALVAVVAACALTTGVMYKINANVDRIALATERNNMNLSIEKAIA